MMPNSGSLARKLGEPKYYTGQPCKFGHVEPRYSHNGQCIGCAREASKANRLRPEAKLLQRGYYERLRRESPETIMWRSARLRARNFGVPFDIVIADITQAWPEDGLCPILGIQLRHNYDGTGGNAKHSPSLDRIIPEFGYVKGNIVVISQNANLLKGDETDSSVFRRIAEWLDRVKGA